MCTRRHIASAGWDLQLVVVWVRVLAGALSPHPNLTPKALKMNDRSFSNVYILRSRAPSQKKNAYLRIKRINVFNCVRGRVAQVLRS